MNPLIIYLAVGLMVFVGVCSMLKKRSMKTKEIFIYSASILNIAVLILNQAIYHYYYDAHVLTLLPLHLCYMAVLATPIAIIYDIKLLKNFIFHICTPGAFLALFFPYYPYIDGTFSPLTFTYFFCHFLLLSIPLWSFSIKLYVPKINIKELALFTCFLFFAAAAIHQVNIYLLNSGIEGANYCMSVMEISKDNNVLCAFFISILPRDFFYLLFFYPIVFAYIGGWVFRFHFVRLYQVIKYKFDEFVILFKEYQLQRNISEKQQG